MESLRRVGMWVAAVVVVVSVAGCGGGDGGGGSGKSSKPSSSSARAKPTSQRPAVTVDEALDAYQKAAAAGCTDAPSCQDQMTAKLAAVKDLRVALVAEDAEGYAEPVQLIQRAERLADHYGRDNLGAKGNSLAVNQPLQQAVSWLAVNR